MQHVKMTGIYTTGRWTLAFQRYQRLHQLMHDIYVT